jgi:hypothetical protein
MGHITITNAAMRIFHPVNNLVVTRNQWLILFSKFRFFFQILSHYHQKILKF